MNRDRFIRPSFGRADASYFWPSFRGSRQRRVGLSPARVSERIAALETRSGARLLVRTTRSLSLTDEGRLYLDTARSVLAEIDDLAARLRDGSERISGRVRLGAPVDLGRNRVAPLLDDFMSRHPDVAVELILSDGLGDLVSDGMDFVVRYGVLEDSGLIVRRLAANRRLVSAAPAYVEIATRRGIFAVGFALVDDLGAARDHPPHAVMQLQRKPGSSANRGRC